MIDKFKDNFLEIFRDGDLLFKIVDKLLTIVLIIVGAIILTKVLAKLIDYFMLLNDNANKKFNININKKKSETLHKLINSSLRYTIYFIAFFQILSTLGVNTTSIVASAGIASVAIGFGAQSLVKDIISGFFIILEGQFDVGDNVKVYNQSAFIAGGTVLALGLRSTKILSSGGEIYFVPNGTINQVVNYSLTYNLAKVEFPITIDTTVDEIVTTINTLLTNANASEDYKKLLYKNNKLIVDTIDKIENNIVHVTIVGKAKVGKKLSVETMLRKDFYNVFKERLATVETK